MCRDFVPNGVPTVLPPKWFYDLVMMLEMERTGTDEQFEESANKAFASVPVEEEMYRKQIWDSLYRRHGLMT